jgi:hypothetical protein
MVAVMCEAVEQGCRHFGVAEHAGPFTEGEARGDDGHKIDIVVRKSLCESNDPSFTAKAADVVGLYVARPRWHCAMYGREPFDPGFGASVGLSEVAQ